MATSRIKAKAEYERQRVNVKEPETARCATYGGFAEKVNAHILLRHHEATEANSLNQFKKKEEVQGFKKTETISVQGSEPCREREAKEARRRSALGQRS